MSNKELVMKEVHTDLMSLMDSKKEALPNDLNRTRFLQNCMTVLQDTKNIEACQPLSVARTLLKGAFLGLDFFQKECYAIPYGNTLQFQTSYIGETKMAKKHSIRPIKDIYAKAVREGDAFEEEIRAGQQIINFKPKSFNNGKLIGAVAVVLYVDGGMEYETMTAEQIENIRNKFSKMPNSLMWKNTPEEAYKKTVLRRLTKKIEKDFSATEGKIYEEASDMDFSKQPTEKHKVPTDVLYKQDEPVDAEYVESQPENKAEDEEAIEVGKA